MGKVQRTQQSHDADLAEQGLRRSYRLDISEHGRPIYREHIMKILDHTENKTPWWKLNAKKAKRSKSSQA